MLRREEEAKERKRRREEKMTEAETINKVARKLMILNNPIIRYNLIIR